jgi:hypothetical protein
MITNDSIRRSIVQSNLFYGSVLSYFLCSQLFAQSFDAAPPLAGERGAERLGRIDCEGPLAQREVREAKPKAELAAPADGDQQEAIESAIRKSIPLLEKGAAGHRDQRTCFTCHGQTLPVLALVAANQRGFTIDKDNLQSQVKRAADHMKRGRKNYLIGRGQGGGHTTAGYALWTMEVGGAKPDEVTTAVGAYLVWDKKADHWRSSSNRPPSEGSHFTATYLAVRALDVFGAKEQADLIASRKKKSLDWLLRTKAKDTEDRVFRLLALHRLDADSDTIRAAAKQLIESQRDDGGWAQIADLKSDAYATGSALFSLHEAEQIEVGDPVYRRGLRFLLQDQRDDGSWFVKSRSKPFQKHFESGFPHGKDQFISITGSGWATLALSLAAPEREPAKGGE